MAIRSAFGAPGTFRLLSALCALSLSCAIAAQAADSERYVHEAEDYLRRGEPKAAVIQLKNALQQEPDNARARLLLGKTYLELGQARAAEQALNKAMELGAPEGEVLALLGEAYLQQGRYREILNEFQVAQEAPAALRAAVLILHARAEFALGQRIPAKAKFAEVLRLEPENVEAFLGLARIALTEGDYDTAGSNLEPALELAPDNADVWVTKGELARQQGKMQEAKEAFTRAVALAPTSMSPSAVSAP